MAEETNIAWADSTFNAWIGCQKVSAGCDNCYAETLMDKRYHRVSWGQRKSEDTAASVGARSRTSAAYWRQPITWNKSHAAFQAKHGHRQRVFCASLADVFDNQVPTEWRVDLWNLIRATPNLDWLLLTKRPENIEKMLTSTIKEIGLSRNPPNINPTDMQMPWPNVWIGITAEDQENFDRRWAIMQHIPAAVRFCSYEPAIGPLYIREAPGLNWLICGGESGRNYRPMATEWAVGIKNDCCRLGIPFFMKQLSGEKPGNIPIPDYLMQRQFPRTS